MYLTVFLSGYEYKNEYKYEREREREREKRKSSQVTFACKHNRN